MRMMVSKNIYFLTSIFMNQKLWLRSLVSMLLVAVLVTSSLTVVVAKDSEVDDNPSLSDLLKDRFDDEDDSDDDDSFDDDGGRKPRAIKAILQKKFMDDHEEEDDDEDEDGDDSRHMSEQLVVYWGKLANLEDRVEGGSDKVAAVDYSGTYAIQDAKWNLVKKLRFEESEDSVDRAATKFVSKIHGGVDGLAFHVVKEASVDPVFTFSFAGKDAVSFKASEVTESGFKKDFGDGYGFMAKMSRADRMHHGMLNEDKFKEAKLRVETKLAEVKLKLENLAECKELRDKVVAYNSLEEGKIVDFIKELVASESAEKCLKLKTKFENEVKSEQRELKFKKGLIPFRDVDDEHWFGAYVKEGKDRGVFSGFKNERNELTGEFKPADNVRLGEVLKVAALLAKLDEKSVNLAELKNEAAGNAWFAPFVKLAEDKGLTLAKDEKRDFAKYATRAQVIRVMMEFLDAEFTDADACTFSDLPKTHPDYEPICLAVSLGIVEGDAGKDTFRPDANLNRAEFAKIFSKFREVYAAEL